MQLLPRINKCQYSLLLMFSKEVIKLLIMWVASSLWFSSSIPNPLRHNHGSWMCVFHPHYTHTHTLDTFALLCTYTQDCTELCNSMPCCFGFSSMILLSTHGETQPAYSFPLVNPFQSHCVKAPNLVPSFRLLCIHFNSITWTHHSLLSIWSAEGNTVVHIFCSLILSRICASR